MASVWWNISTLSGFVLGAPLLQVLLATLILWWEYILLPPYCVLMRAIYGSAGRPLPSYIKPLPVFLVIPTLLRKRDELVSLLSTLDSIRHNGYPGPLTVVASIDGTQDSPELYRELCAWAHARRSTKSCSLYVTGTPGRRGKPMAVEHAIEMVHGLVDRGVIPEFPPVLIGTDADADLGPRSLEALVYRLQRRNWFTGAPARAVAGALHVRDNARSRGWRTFFSVSGQLNLQVARDYYVSNVTRYNIRLLPVTGIPGALYCTWSEIFLAIPSLFGYARTLRRRHWLRWWLGIQPPKFSDSTAEPIPELVAGDTDDTVTAYAATMARYRNGHFSFDPPRTPLHAIYYMLRGIFVDRAIQYAPEARVYTSSPVTIKALFRQRKRWNTARIELTGRFWRLLGYNWELGLPAIIVKALMARSLVGGLLAYMLIPMAFWKTHLVTALVIIYVFQVAMTALLTAITLVMNQEPGQWRLCLALPLAPVYGFCFKLTPGTIGAICDVFLLGNKTGFAPEATLKRGGSVRIALFFRIRRAFALLLRSVTCGDVPLGAFWFGWSETPWTPSGFEGWTSKRKPGRILPPVREWFRRHRRKAVIVELPRRAEASPVPGPRLEPHTTDFSTRDSPSVDGRPN